MSSQEAKEPAEGSRDRNILVAAFLLAITPLAYTVFDTNDGDIPHYFDGVGHALRGELPYRDYIFEYPPYALLFFVLPCLARGYYWFRILFGLELLALDVAAITLLYRTIAKKNRVAISSSGIVGRVFGSPGASWVVPAAFAIGTSLQAYYLLKRLDVIAASLVALAFCALARSHFKTAGFLIAIGAGVKLYPAILVPALFVLAWREKKARAFVIGLVIGTAPLFLLGLWLPWWRFASFHAARGLQVESTYASVLWLLHFFGLPLKWVGRPIWMEVEGPAATSLLTFARPLFALATLASVALSAAALFPKNADRSMPAVARAVLVPILAFAGFNIVFSGQYAIWFVAPAAIAVAKGERGSALLITIALFFTLFVFPAPGYAEIVPGRGELGIDLGHAVILVARNVLVIAAWVILARQAWRSYRAR